MAVVTLRPDSTTDNVGFTVFGGSVVDEVLSDDSDSTGVTAGTSGTGKHMRVGFPNGVIPAGATITSITPRVRYIRSDFVAVMDMRVFRGSAPEFPVESFGGTGGSIITVALTTRAVDQDGNAWTVSSVEALEFQILANGAAGSNTWREVYLDVEFTAGDTFEETITDDLGLTDTVAYDLLVLHQRTITDDLALTDETTRAQDLAPRVITDALALTDEIEPPPPPRVRAVATDDELLLLDPRSRRAEGITFELVEPDGTAWVPTGDLLPVVSDRPASVTNDTTRNVKRTCGRLLIPAPHVADLDVFRDRFMVVWTLENASRFPLGVYGWGSKDDLPRSYGRDAECTGVDQGGLLLDEEIGRDLSYGPGTVGRDVLLALAADADVPLVDADPNPIGFGAPIGWTPDKTRREVMADICALVGYLSPYFDNRGVLRLRVAFDLAISDPTLRYGRGDGHTGRVYLDSIVESDDTMNAPNRYRVIGSSATDTPIVGVYDIPDDAPHSLKNRGRLRTRTDTAQGLADTTAANAAARAAANEDPAAFRWVGFDAAPDPRHDTYDVVSWEDRVHREIRWTLELAPGGKHAHDLRRAWGDGPDA